MCATEHNALPCSGVMSENAQNRMHFFLLCAKAHRKSCDGRGYSPSRRSGPRTPVAYTGIRGRNESAARRSVSAFHDREKHMNKYGSFSKPLMWFMALLMAAFVAGCGGGDDGAAAPSAAGAVCSGTAADCVPLLTAGDFVILAESTITSVPPSAITGNVGLEAGASITGLTCPEVSLGKVINSDAGFADASCVTQDGPRLTQAETDRGLAFANAASTVAHPVTSSNPTGPTITAGVYDFTGDVVIPTDITLSGSPTDVWIFQIPGDLALTTGNVLLTGGALPQNVFWRATGTVSIGAGRQFPGIVMANSTIDLGGGAAVNGRLYSLTAVTLTAGSNTVLRP